MSNQRFIKFIPSEESLYLIENYPNAFLLLTIIATRARRIAGNPDGLEIGECHVGDYKKAGIETRDKYRTALDILIARSHIKKVETCRNRKKCPTGNPTIATKVKLLKSSVCDVNLEKDPHPDPHRTPTGSQTDPHEQELTMTTKNEKKSLKGQCIEPESLINENDIAKDNALLDQEKKKSRFPLKKEQSDIFEKIKALDLNTDDETIKYWVREKKYQGKHDRAIFFYKHEISRGCKIDNPGGFFRRCLDGKIIVLGQENLDLIEFCQDYIHANNYTQLKIFKKYVKDVSLNEELYFSMNPGEFVNSLVRIHEKSLTYASI